MVYNLEQMKIAIAPGVHVLVDDADLQLLHAIERDSFNSFNIDESSRKRLKSLMSKGIVKRSKRQGQVRYEVRRDIFR